MGPEAPPANGSPARAVQVALTGSATIDGVLWGTKWTGGAISYSDPDSTADYQAGYTSGQPNYFSGFAPLSAGQLQVVQGILDETRFTQLAGATGLSVEAFTGLAIGYAGHGSGAGTIRLADTSSAIVPTAQVADFPSNGIRGGDVWFGGSGRAPVTGSYGYHSVIHELGHALGLKHGHQAINATGDHAPVLPGATDSMEFSVMTYRSYVGSDAQFYYNETWGYAQTFMMYDIRALQQLYGADFTANGGDTTYTWSPTDGSAFIDGSLALDPGGNRIFETIWDGNGNDTYDLSNYGTDLSIDLEPGGHSTFSSVQRAYLGGGPNGGYARGNVFNALKFKGDPRSLIENAEGGSGQDLIHGNAGANRLAGNGGNDTLQGDIGNDSLSGGAGADRLLGGTGKDMLLGEAGKDVLLGGIGRDLLVGGAGNDRFDFDFTSDSVPGANCDVLQSGGGNAFDGAGNPAGDLIDLFDIDANTTTGGNQAFVFGGTGKGHVWCVNSGTTTEVFANVDNDAAAEFQLDILDGGVLASAYKAVDFIL